MEINYIALSGYLLSIIIHSFFFAAFTKWFHWAAGGPGNLTVDRTRIFSRYGLWVDRKYTEYERGMKTAKNVAYLNSYKALGACIYCFLVWITFLGLTASLLLGTIVPFTDYKIIEIILLYFITPAISNIFLLKL